VIMYSFQFFFLLFIIPKVDIINLIQNEIASLEYHLNLFWARKLEEWEHFSHQDSNNSTQIYIHNFKFSISVCDLSNQIQMKSCSNIKHSENGQEIFMKKSFSSSPLFENKNKQDECIGNPKIERIKIETSFNQTPKKKNETNFGEKIDEKEEMLEKSCNICKLF
jgi:hypothetical protein